MTLPTFVAAVLAVGLLAAAAPTAASEATIRQVLQERFPGLKIESVRPSPVPGLWEVLHDGTEILYSDAGGEHLFVGGALIETKTRADLTERRLNEILSVAWDQMPLKDAITIRQGSAKRQLAVFADPNCGFCRRFERDIAGMKDLTVHVFLLPILGPDSNAKSRDIWCAANRGKAWRDWMLEGRLPGKAKANCNTQALDRNLAFSRTHRINGTPALFFTDGTRRPGALPAEQVEQLLTAAAAAR